MLHLPFKGWNIQRFRTYICALVITHLKSQFARHSIPDRLITDNGPQFSSDAFKQFTKDYCFQHSTSCLHYPQSNGMAEKAALTVKNLLKKAHSDKQNPYLVLQQCRNMPMFNNHTHTATNGAQNKNITSNI